MAAKPKKKSEKAPAGKSPSVITEEQWGMPVSFDREGKPVSLRDYVEQHADAIPFPALSDEQRTDLAARRIELQAKYEMAAIGAGVVSKQQAIAEVRSKTPLGRRLTQIEMRVITHLLNEATPRSS